MKTFVLKLISRAHPGQTSNHRRIEADSVNAAAESIHASIKIPPESLTLNSSQHYVGENVAGYWFLEEEK